MHDPVRLFFNPEWPLPGMLCLVDKPVPAALAEDQGELLINLLLQFFWIRLLNLIEDLF
jgi:hypothetical protein